MLDALTMAAYLFGQTAQTGHTLQLSVNFPEKTATVSPVIRWQHVPPEANSLVVIIRDAEHHYYWIAYNLPVDGAGLPLGANTLMMSHDEGLNSFGEQNYHAPWKMLSGPHALSVELYALDKRLTADAPLTGDELLAKMKNAVIDSAKISFNQP